MAFDMPTTWKLIAQMPFGLADEEPTDRMLIPFETMVKF